MSLSQENVDHFGPALYPGVSVVGVTALFEICMKEVPAIPIIKTIFVLEKKRNYNLLYLGHLWMIAWSTTAFVENVLFPGRKTKGESRL